MHEESQARANLDSQLEILSKKKKKEQKRNAELSANLQRQAAELHSEKLQFEALYADLKAQNIGSGKRSQQRLAVAEAAQAAALAAAKAESLQQYASSSLLGVSPPTLSSASLMLTPQADSKRKKGRNSSSKKPATVVAASAHPVSEHCVCPQCVHARALTLAQLGRSKSKLKKSKK